MEEMQPKSPWRREVRETDAVIQDRFRAKFQKVLSAFLDAENTDTSRESAKIIFCRTFLNRPLGEHYESFTVDSKGALQPDTKPNISLLAWASKSGLGGTHTPEDLRKAALEVNQQFPDIEFNFKEDREKSKFSVTATLRKAKQSAE